MDPDYYIEEMSEEIHTGKHSSSSFSLIVIITYEFALGQKSFSKNNR